MAGGGMRKGNADRLSKISKGSGEEQGRGLCGAGRGKERGVRRRDLENK